MRERDPLKLQMCRNAPGVADSFGPIQICDFAIQRCRCRELVFRAVHYRSLRHSGERGARREGHEIALVTVIRGMQDIAKRDKIEIDVARSARERKKRKTRGTARDKGEEKDSGFRRTGHGRDGDREISQTQRPFFFPSDGAPVSRKRRRIEYMGGIIGINYCDNAASREYAENARERRRSLCKKAGAKSERKREIAKRSSNSAGYHDARISGTERIDLWSNRSTHRDDIQRRLALTNQSKILREENSK